jgi:SAM-dependent methyltransferase
MKSTEAAEFYDAMWQGYAALDAVSPAAFHRRRLVRKLLLELAPRALHVLDAGCGRGELLAELSKALPGARMSGADVSAEGRRAAQASCPAAEIFELDLEASGFAATQQQRLGRYDVVVCSEVLEHLDDDALGLARLTALLAPGGLLVVTVPGGKKSRFDELIGHRRHYSRRTLRSLLKGGDLAVERLWAWGFPFHNAYRSAVRLASRFAFAPPSERGPAPPADEPRNEWLGRAYRWFGGALKPLYYANRRYWGEQLIAAARRR